MAGFDLLTGAGHPHCSDDTGHLRVRGRILTSSSPTRNLGINYQSIEHNYFFKCLGCASEPAIAYSFSALKFNIFMYTALQAVGKTNLTD